ncbi:MAG: dTDP-4-dehydrorhamnose reductase [Pseudomonadota bacterium]
MGRELARTSPSGATLSLAASSDCDVGDAQAVAALIRRERPDVIINAAAYTAVDKAEVEVAKAEHVNVQGPANLAACAGSARLLHVSTDFVFDGSKGQPWLPSDSANPASVYGRTKLAGEAPVLALGERGLVLRTSWVYSQFGNNFVKTMLKLMASRPEVRVVADQVGAPTWARGLASALWRAVELPGVHGLHHWRDAGVASWYDFAVAISEEGAARQLAPEGTRILPIATQDYPTPARRPSYSLLDCAATWSQLGITPPHWRNNLRLMLNELKENHG